MAEMIDILNKLREYEKRGAEVSDAIKSTEMTQTEKPVQEHCHTFQDFLKRENLPPVEKMNFNDYAKAAEMYAKHKAEMAKDESVNEVGGMSDVHIGAQEIVGDYVDDDGNLKMPKMQVIADMDKKKRQMDFPKSYEYDVAMGMVRDDFDDGGARKPEIDAEAEVQEKQGVDHDKDGDIDSKDYLKSRDIAIKKAMGKDINKKDDMKKENVKEDMHIMTDSPEEMGMMMQILKLAGVKPVDAKMIGAEEPADETELANSPAGYHNDQKVQSIDDLVNTHSGGLNRQKIQIKKGHPGDNELTAEDLATDLTAQYESFKKTYQAEAKKAEESTEEKK